MDLMCMCAILRLELIANTEQSPHFTLVCKNCSLYGSIEVFSGSLTANLSESSNSTMAAFEYWEHGGFVELLVNDFSAHIELETSIAPSKDLIVWTAHFPPLAFPLFQVPLPKLSKLLS